MPIRRRRYKKNARRAYVPSIYRRRFTSTKYMRVALDFISQLGKTTGYVYENSASPIWTVESMLSGSDAWTDYAKVFSFAKLNALAISVTPSSSCNANVNSPYYVCVAYMAREGENPTLEVVRENPSCMILSPLEKSYKYVNLCGNTAEWVPFSYQRFGGRMVAASNVNPTVSPTLTWTVKVTLYFVFKLPLI